LLAEELGTACQDCDCQERRGGEGEAFCATCGHPSAHHGPRRCSGCGRSAETGSSFCPGCGARLGGDQAGSTAPPEVPAGLEPSVAAVYAEQLQAAAAGSTSSGPPPADAPQQPVTGTPFNAPPPQYAIPYPVQYAVPVAVRTNGLAIASMVLGILWFYWVGSVLALVFGYVAKGQIDASRGTQGGRGMATAGIVLGWIGVAVFALLLLAGISVGMSGP
jgi:hypothetical protein